MKYLPGDLITIRPAEPERPVWASSGARAVPLSLSDVYVWITEIDGHVLLSAPGPRLLTVWDARYLESRAELAGRVPVELDVAAVEAAYRLRGEGAAHEAALVLGLAPPTR